MEIEQPGFQSELFGCSINILRPVDPVAELVDRRWLRGKLNVLRSNRCVTRHLIPPFLIARYSIDQNAAPQDPATRPFYGFGFSLERGALETDAPLAPVRVLNLKRAFTLEHGSTIQGGQALHIGITGL